MFDKTEQSVIGNGNITAGRDVYLSQVVNNERHINIYEYDIVNVIEQFDNNIDLFLDDKPFMLSESGKYDFAEKVKKNQLNNLSEEYFEVLKEDFLPYFYKIDDFLRNPQNKKLQNKYKNVSLQLKATIAANRNKYNGFEEIISDISNSLSKAIKDEIELNPLVIMVFLSYMYWNCDIGRRK